MAEMIRKHAPTPSGLCSRLGRCRSGSIHALTAEGLPAICIDARHAKARSTGANKTDANDADGLAHLAEAGFYKDVRVKAFDSMLTRTLVAARTQLLSITTQLRNQIRGLMKTFGLVVPRGKGRHVRGECSAVAGGQCRSGPDHLASA